MAKHPITTDEYINTLVLKVKNIQENAREYSRALTALADIRTAMKKRKLPSLDVFASDEVAALTKHDIWLMQDCIRYMRHNYQYVMHDQRAEKNTGSLIICFYEAVNNGPLLQELFELRQKYPNLRHYVS